MEKYDVLVVDDSAFMRKTISSLVETSPHLNVIGKARNGLDAIEKTNRLKPHVIILDIEMPIMNGLEALKQLMSNRPTPVIMLTNDAESTLKAFEYGAIDFVVKNGLLENVNPKKIEDFISRIITAANAKIITIPLVEEEKIKEVDSTDSSSLPKGHHKYEILVIGCSTGGPAALQQILPRFKKDFPVPVIVIQHMPIGFTKSLAERFNKLSPLNVKEAENNERLEPGTIYIAPAGLQTTVQPHPESGYQIRLKLTTMLETLYKPSVDVTLLSIAPLLKNRLLTVILTGMGDDGLRGCQKVKSHNGTILTEAEQTCVVYGMPKVVTEGGLSDQQVKITQMYDQIMGQMFDDIESSDS